MAEDREVVDGDDERARAAKRAAIGRAVEHVGARGAHAREHGRVPRGSRQTVAVRARRRSASELEVDAPLEAREEPAM